MRRLSRIATALWALGALIALVGCHRHDEQQKAASQGHASSTLPEGFDATTLRRGNGPEPESLDPQLARTDAAFNILRDLFEGLTAVGPDGAAVAGAA